MENESNLGQPIPTAILTPTEIITPPDATTEAAKMQPAQDPAQSDTYQHPMHLVTEMMLAPMHFWAAVSTSYLKLFEISAKPSAWPRLN